MSRYQVERPLGSGGMGVVYEALDRDTGSHVALKTLKRSDAVAIARFKNEFRALADVSHPNLVSLYELHVDDDRLFFTMELVRGIDFVRWVRHEPPTPEPEPEPATETAQTRELEPDTVQGYLARRPIARGGGDTSELDLKRLRAGLRQLAEAVAAIHAAGFLHRDLKPSNVLVTPEGRVVVLDFGLITERELEQSALRDERSRVGTPSYMSPEQGARLPLTPASDWYSVGVILYRALTGRMPFYGHEADVLMDKQQFEPPPPRQLADGIPADLDALCAELLRREPERRPSGAEVLRRLGVRDHDGGARATASVTVDAVLVGRAAQLAQLDAAFRDAQAGAAVLAYVQGRSGMGKSTLVRRFLSQLPDEAVVLRGRCYEQESVPFKAVDSLVDALGAYLAALPDADARALMPRDAHSLARLFPVLRQVEAVSGARRRGADAPDPRELRRRAFAALRELLTRVADRHALVLAIDDVQWGDADSAALLAALLRPPDPPPLLLLAMYREEDTATSAFLPRLAEETADVDVRRVEVGPLARGEARELAVVHLGGGGAAHADRIADESAGSPLFVEELARHVVDRLDAPGGVSLDDALAARLRRLPEDARALLVAIAVAARPVPQPVAFRAARVDDPGLLALLKAGNFVVSRSRHGERYIEPYHDRVRETVVAALDAAALRAAHARLAAALETTATPDPETLAQHYLGAGDPERAAELAVVAARRAREALAFDRAARLFALALELGAAGLHAELGDALANAGRGPAAADAYLAACEGASEDEQLDLRRRAAQQLLRSGHVERGLEVVSRVLGAVGLRLAPTPRRALLSIGLGRARLAVRGRRFRERAEGEIPSRELLRIDIARDVSEGLAMIDGIRGADFEVKHTLLALRAGEPRRVARALSGEAAFQSRFGLPAAKYTARVLRDLERLARRLDDAGVNAVLAAIRGITAFHEGRWREAYDACHIAESLLRDRGAQWELSMVQLFEMYSLTMLGGVSEIRARLPDLVREATERSDLFTVTTLRTALEVFVWLAADDPARARRETLDALAQWTAPGFHVQHAYAAMACAAADIYDGDGASAVARCDEVWPDLKRMMMLHVQLFRVGFRAFRGRALVVAGRGAEAEREARALAREQMRYAQACAAGIRAGVAGLAGDRERALAQVADAERLFTEDSMAAFAACARRQRGVLLGGDEGEALVVSADAVFAAEGFVSPERLTRAIVPLGGAQPGSLAPSTS